MTWIHLRLRPASLGKRKNEIAVFSAITGFSFDLEPPEHSVVAAEEVARFVVVLVPVAANALAAALMAPEATLLGAVVAELALALAALTDAAEVLPAPELLAPMAA